MALAGNNFKARAMSRLDPYADCRIYLIKCPDHPKKSG
jgi:hypothetical protein